MSEPCDAWVRWRGSEDLLVFLERANRRPPIIIPHAPDAEHLAIGVRYPGSEPEILISSYPERWGVVLTRLWFCEVPWQDCQGLFEPMHVIGNLALLRLD